MTKTCNNCNQPVNDAAKFCEHCGVTLQVQAVTSPEPQLPLIMNTDRSLDWSNTLMKLGFKPLSISQRKLLNDLLREGKAQPQLGEQTHEVEIGVLGTVKRAGWQALAKALFVDQAETEVWYISAFASNGELRFTINNGNGLLLITNTRLVTLSYDPARYWQSDGFDLDGVEYEQAKLRLFLKNGAYYEIGLTLPTASFSAGLSSTFAEDTVTREAAWSRVLRQEQKGSDARTTVIGFFNELIHGARQARAISNQ